MFLRQCLLCLVALLPNLAPCQNLYVENYTQKQYAGFELNPSPQNWEMEQDTLGRLYIANSTGVMLFDGLTWSMIPGTENYNMYSLSRAQEGIIFTGGRRDLGYFKSDSTGRVVYHSLLPLLKSADIFPGEIESVKALDNSVYFKNDDGLIVLNDGNVNFYPLKSRNKKIGSYKGKIVNQDLDGNIVSFYNQRFETLYSFEDQADFIFVSLLELSNDELLLFTEEDGVYSVNNGELTKWDLQHQDGFTSIQIEQAIHFPELELIGIATKDQGITVVNYNGRRVNSFGTNQGLPSNTCYSLFRDRNQDLWACLDIGISRIEYPSIMDHFDYTSGLNGVVNCVAEYENSLYVGTTSGLYLLDGRNQFNNFSLKREIWDLQVIDGTLWISSSSGLYTIENGKIQLQLDASSRTIKASADKNKLWVGTDKGLGTLVKRNANWYWQGHIEGINHEVRFVAVESDSIVWGSFEKISKITYDSDLEKVMDVNTMTKENGYSDDFFIAETYLLRNKVFFGTALGLYSFNAETNMLAPDASFGEQFASGKRETWAMSENNDQSIWMSSNNRNGKLIFEDGQVVAWDTLPFARLTSTDVWRTVTIENSPIVYFCTTDGLFKHDQSISKNYDIAYNTLINKIELKRDSTISNLEIQNADFSADKSIDYTYNDIRFSYTATTYNFEEKILFSHFLEHYDDGWSDWEAASIKEYTNLPPGNYIFRVKAKNLYGVEAQTAEYGFTIRPPWYRTFWAYGIFAAFFISGIVVLDRYQRKRLFKKQQARIRRQEQKLEREREISNKLRKVDRLKDEFLANTSHELRTPLNGIIGISESLYEGSSEVKEDELKMNLGMVIASGKRLASLVDSILDYSKLKTENLEIRKRPVDLKSIVKVVLTMSRPLIARDSLKLVDAVPEDLPLVEADENRLQQILYNLVGNAIKFSESGRIEVAASSIGDDVEIVVSDEGVGIPEDKIAKIFDSYEQLDVDVSREYVGTGLGLTITKKLVELHDGMIWAESEKDKGSKFIFTIPVSLQEAPGWVSTDLVEEDSNDQPPKIAEVNGAKFNVLIVDDEPVNRQVLINHLKGEPYHLEVASSGSEALDLVKQHPFDLVLLDVMMPKMSGFEVCMKIREEYMLSELPVIFITAKGQIIDLVEGLKYGGNDYITKPFSKQEFLARIKTHLNLFKINDSYSRFIPHEFLQSLGRESIMDVNLGDQIEKEVTILFSDIRDYTSLSEKMTPMENFNFLNSILNKMGPIIRENDGFVMQYLGDGLMSIFLHEPIHAVRAAIEMSQKIEKYNADRASKSRAPIQIGFGLHTGRLVLGVIGDEKRMDVNVVSDSVNTASRMEGLTKHYGASIIMSEKTLEKLPDQHDIDCRFLGMVRLKGKSMPLKIYEVLEGLPAMEQKLKTETKSLFEEGLQRYLQKDFINAAAAFKQVAAANDADKSAQIYLKHAAKFMVEKVPDDWTGIETMHLK